MNEMERRIWEVRHELRVLETYRKTTLSAEIAELIFEDMQRKGFELQTLLQETTT